MYYDIIENYELDCIPKNIYYRNILKNNQFSISIKQDILSSKLVKKITNQQFEDGSWDLGSKAKDNVYLPFSDSWRKEINRKIDSTLLILNYLKNIGYQQDKR